MKKFILLFAASLLMFGCSSTQKLIPDITYTDQAACVNEKQIDANNQFFGETADNLTLDYINSNLVCVMDVRTLCNAKLAYKIEVKDAVIKLKVYNSNPAKTDCTCSVKAKVNVSHLQKGKYTVMVTDEKGSKLLAQKDYTIN